MKVVWADTNVLLRFLTKRPLEQWRRADALMRRAGEGKLVVHVPAVVVAEVAAVLHHSFEQPLDQVARVLSGLLLAEGIEVEDESAVLEALRLTETLTVDFVDAYVAVKAREAGAQIVSFDSDFPRRLGVTPFAI